MLLNGPAERRAKVVVLALQPVEPGVLVATSQLGMGGLRQVGEVGRVATPGGRFLASGGQLSQRELADRLQQPQPRLAITRLCPLQQALVGQRREQFERSRGDASIFFSTPRLLDSSTRHRFGGGQRKAAGEHAEAAKEGPLGRG